MVKFVKQVTDIWKIKGDYIKEGKEIESWI